MNNDASQLPVSGLTGAAETTVESANTARTLKSGSLAVFGTPALLALMEQAACAAVQTALPAGCTTVGAEMQLTHTAPTAVGGRIRATATLTKVEGKRLTFDCTARDERGEVGRCTQARYIVDSERFLKKATERQGE